RWCRGGGDDDVVVASVALAEGGRRWCGCGDGCDVSDEGGVIVVVAGVEVVGGRELAGAAPDFANGWSDREHEDSKKKEEICIMVSSNEVRQNVKLDPDEWIQDSGCTIHMTGNKDLFSSYKTFDGCEPKNIKEAIQDESWTMAMQEELNQFKSNDVWCLVPPPKNQTVIGTKWVFKNKLDENGVVSRNKARLVAQGYNQQEGIDFDETYAPMARLESIRILLAYACAHNFKLY
ncbi:retrovirus-related pol polyprotein from transposon TNT 1-94, partial [Tanacetum coccineum]